MLATWEVAVQWRASAKAEASAQAIDITRLLGWTRDRTDSDRPQMNRTADAWNAARNPIAEAGPASAKKFFDKPTRASLPAILLFRRSFSTESCLWRIRK